MATETTVGEDQIEQQRLDAIAGERDRQVDGLYDGAQADKHARTETNADAPTPSVVAQHELDKLRRRLEHVKSRRLVYLELACAHLAHAAFHVLTYLVLRADRDLSRTSTFPGVETIAKRTGMTEAAVHQRLQELTRAGWVKRRRRGRGRSWTTQFVVPGGILGDGDGNGWQGP